MDQRSASSVSTRCHRLSPLITYGQALRNSSLQAVTQIRVAIQLCDSPWDIMHSCPKVNRYSNIGPDAKPRAG